jgi:SAM-dependent methyltransferase
VPDFPVDGSSFNNYSWTEEWTKDFPNHVKKARYSLTRKLEIMKRLSGKKVTSMLDIGCGNGAFLAAAKEIGIYAEGTDIDLKHTQFAIDQGFKATHCDITEYQTDRQFDLIHVKESFHLVMNSKEFVERAVKLMNANTILYLDSTHADGLASRYRKRFINAPRYGQLYPTLHNRAFNRRSFAYILEHAGLEIVKFVSFNRGNRVYCPSKNLNVRQYAINPLLDLAFLGGFIGCYAMKKAS